MIDKIIYALLLVGALALATQVAFILFFAVLAAGLIFRTKETLGLLMLGGLFTALSAAPVITLCILAVLVKISLTLKAREQKQIGSKEEEALTEVDGPAS